jgi:hypothetical protein
VLRPGTYDPPIEEHLRPVMSRLYGAHANALRQRRLRQYVQEMRSVLTLHRTLCMLRVYGESPPLEGQDEEDIRRRLLCVQGVQHMFWARRGLGPFAPTPFGDPQLEQTTAELRAACAALEAAPLQETPVWQWFRRLRDVQFWLRVRMHIAGYPQTQLLTRQGVDERLAGSALLRALLPRLGLA